MFKSFGILQYDPHARIKSEPWWCILKTGEGIIEYYKHWIKKMWDVQFEKTVWGSHISVNRGYEPPNKEAWKKYEGEPIRFTYSNKIYQPENNPWFFCVDAYSQRLEEIRTELGLSPTPLYGFHLTIARLNKQYVLNYQK